MKGNYILREFLKERQLKKPEIDIYIFLVRFGSQSVGSIARGTGIKRSSCYDYIHRLRSRKFVMNININGVMKVEAVDLEVILNRLHDDLYVKYINSVKKINYLQSYNLDYDELKVPSSPEIITYCSSNALSEIYNEALDSEYILAYFDGSFSDETHSKIDNEYTLKRIHRKIPIKILLPKTESSARFVEEKREQREVKFINKEDLGFEGLTLITKNKVLTFSPETNNGVCVKSKLFAKNQAAFFDLVWGGK